MNSPFYFGIPLKDIAQTFHRNKFECSTETGLECGCYDDFISEKYNITAVHTKVNGESVLSDISFEKNNLLRNILKLIEE